MKKRIGNIIRIFWYVSYRIFKYLGFRRRLDFPKGWDTLCPLAPYSEGGLLRKDFMELYRKKKITVEEYDQKAVGSFDQEKKHHQFWYRRIAHQQYLKTWWV